MSAPAIELNGAVVAVTGGARGIGLATAKAFAQRGSRVFIGDIDLETAAAAAAAVDGSADAIRLDVTSRESFGDFVTAIEGDAGGIDVLVNNAGIMPAGRFLDQSDGVIEAQIGINLLGPLNGMKAVLPGMVKRGRGHVVNVASMLGKAHAPGLAVYVATKHAVVGLTDCVRDELDDTGVTFTTVLPTAVKTELVSGLPIGGLFAVTPERVADAIVRSVDRRTEEVAVPRWMGGYSLLKAVTPRPLMHRGRRAIGAWRLMDEIDDESRREYQERIERGAGS